MGAGRIDMARSGFIAVQADPGVAKAKRGEVLTTFAIATPETVQGSQDYGGRDKATAANPLFLRSNPAKDAPRGEAAGLAMGGAPVLRVNGKYRPLLDAGLADDDFDETDAIPIVNGRVGTPPDGTIAYLVNTTRHGAPVTLALHSGPGGGGGGADLVAHHDPDNPPLFSSMVGDISGDRVNLLKLAGLHTVLRVRAMVDQFCRGKTSSGGASSLNSIYLNATKSEGDHTGWLPTTFATHDALGSHERSGALRPATVTHLLGYSREGRPLVPMAVDCDALYTRGDPKFDAPQEILDHLEPDEIGTGVYPVRTWNMLDREPEHPFHCGKRKTLRRWHTPIPVAQKPSCFRSRQTVGEDTNGNPERTFPPAPEVYTGTMLQSTGLRLLSRPGILKGKPEVPHG